jgi:hypothetical protein
MVGQAGRNFCETSEVKVQSRNSSGKGPKRLRKSTEELLKEIREGFKLDVPKELRPPPKGQAPEPPKQNIGQGKPLSKGELDPLGALGKAEQRFHREQVSSGVAILKGEHSIESAADQLNANIAQQVLGWWPREEPQGFSTQKDPGPAPPPEEPPPREDPWPYTQHEQAFKYGPDKVDPNAPEFVTPITQEMMKPPKTPTAEEAGIDNGLGPNNPFNPKPWDPMA